MSLDDSFEDVLRREELHFAAQDGDFEEVTRLLSEGHELNVFDELGKTPLHYAAKGGYLDVMRLLLASGADVNAHDELVQLLSRRRLKNWVIRGGKWFQ